MTTEIVTAYASHNALPPSELSKVIASVANALARLDDGRERSRKRKPAVPVKSAVRRNVVTCLICGRKQKVLKRHLRVAHEVTPAEYREMFDLEPGFPIVAPTYAHQRSVIARAVGLGKAPAQKSARKSVKKAA